MFDDFPVSHAKKVIEGTVVCAEVTLTDAKYEIPLG
jgi:hypothetical protein